MGDEIIIVGIVFGSVLAIVFLSLLSNLVNTWIKRGSAGKLSENKEFLSALREFKEKTERRLSNLEAIAAEQDLDNTRQPDAFKRSEPAGKTIDIELDDLPEDDKIPDRGNLRNMLNQ